MDAQEPQYHRSIELPSSSFLLFGPRGVGKSTWLRKTLPKDSLFIDLLHYPTYLSLSRDPSHLEALINTKDPPQWVCIDEVQKIPPILDEVHRLIETYGLRFALSGSSARKLKRGGANLLAGRALAMEMETFCSEELGEDFHLEESIEWGTLPLVQKKLKEKLTTEAMDTLETYVSSYLREEIKEEGLVRKVDPFLRFLEIAGLMNAEQINLSAIAQQAGVPRSSTETYFSILEDTLLTFRLPAYRPRVKVREQTHPKLYWFDSGVARAAAGLLRDPTDSTWQGKALETLIYHELRVYNQKSGKHRSISFYKTSSGQEIDFLIETQKTSSDQKAEVVLIEVKRSKTWNARWENPMRSLMRMNKMRVKSAYGVYMGKESLFKENLSILPAEIFLKKLHQGEVF
ncbi:MAG: DUF4143 domain-containing protein [Candidatus Gracilibacteria bacterium]